MAASTEQHTWQKAGSRDNRKSESCPPPAQPPIECPECGSEKTWKDGFRYVKTETEELPIQRYVCRSCGRRFSETIPTWVKVEIPGQVLKLLHSRRNHLRAFLPYNCNSQVCVSDKEMKNLSRQRTRKKRAAGATTKADIKGRIIEYLWYLKKQGYAESTVKTRTRLLKQLVNEGAVLRDPEQVKEVIAAHENWSQGYKLTIVNAYDKFAQMLDIKWDLPNYKRLRQLPFIPLEKELDALISGCGKKVAASLQLLKETGMRIGEAWKLRWIDIDEEKRVVRCRSEKGGDPRIFRVSSRLLAMLNALPKVPEKVFGDTGLNGHRWNFTKQKRRLARKLQNPRLGQITFHTLRHWKATMEYHKTKDILHVKQLLGHRNIESTMVYTQLAKFEEAEEFTCRIAKTLDQAKELIEAGFEYITDMDDKKLFRKRK
ncbi:MAG: tyrosine-type recombinase/integrase [Candidatus Bathyarchaeota archaeon]|nr:tyrosine-type recombinase/integrase [Candidatus Bathyarchaeota archaeon]MDH5779033.1 tyrosine-type recombinase/integrase [Candidatus Bathyarchaeota archaeon]